MYQECLIIIRIIITILHISILKSSEPFLTHFLETLFARKQSLAIIQIGDYYFVVVDVPIASQVEEGQRKPSQRGTESIPAAH